ncbi:hypothetical protein DFS34DRAFT_624593 [Phlyctochytrium arcticum]|nr:hypothetical protein DFS34DRAFT_624593 [Phlyctochytrium arcticum]
MPPYLVVSGGSSVESMEPVQVNRYPLFINNDHFEGLLIIRLKDFDESKLPPAPHLPSHTYLNATEYFKSRSRQFSFQVEGQFKQPVNGDNLYWDISFPEPLTGLPFFTPMVVKFLQYLDPATEIDFYAKEQYVRSSVLTMMNAIACWKPLPLNSEEQAVVDEPIEGQDSAEVSDSEDNGAPTSNNNGAQQQLDLSVNSLDSDRHSIASTNGKPAPAYTITRNGSQERILQPETLQNGVSEDLALMISSMRRLSHGQKSDNEPPRSDVAKRRKFFLDQTARARVAFQPDYVYAFESFNPHMCFKDFTAKIPGFNIDVKKYFPRRRMVRVSMCSKDKSITYLTFDVELVDEK